VRLQLGNDDGGVDFVLDEKGGWVLELVLLELGEQDCAESMADELGFLVVGMLNSTHSMTECWGMK
jgi:hypothetical protein